MTKEGRLIRGKINTEYKNLDGSIGRFPQNSETLEYLESIKKAPRETAVQKKAREAEEARALQEEEDARTTE